MNLTEPQCGHRSRPVCAPRRSRQADGSYKITGDQDFHLCPAEHDLAEKTSSTWVLARIEGRTRRDQGRCSLCFVVPKILVNADGTLGARNGVSCGSIEHKMGIHGNSTCVMNYGLAATGWLIGEGKTRACKACS